MLKIAQELPQVAYDRGTKFSEASRLQELQFHAFNLGDAFRKDFRTLVDHDQDAWSADGHVKVARKLSIVFCVSASLIRPLVLEQSSFMLT